jgi:hypothetical protein
MAQADHHLRRAAIVNLEPATFLAGEEGLDMRSFFVQLHRQIQIHQIRDQIE